MQQNRTYNIELSNQYTTIDSNGTVNQWLLVVSPVQSTDALCTLSGIRVHWNVYSSVENKDRKDARHLVVRADVASSPREKRFLR